MKIRLYRQFAGILAAVLLFSSCASSNQLQTVQVTHDSLAAAQDIEANICWGVQTVSAGPADRTHCTAPLAAQLRLTDERHKLINQKLEAAFNLHKNLTVQIQAGGKVDLSALNQVVIDILALVGQLESSPQTTNLQNAVRAGRIQ